MESARCAEPGFSQEWQNRSINQFANERNARTANTCIAALAMREIVHGSARRRRDGCRRESRGFTRAFSHAEIAGKKKEKRHMQYALEESYILTERCDWSRHLPSCVSSRRPVIPPNSVWGSVTRIPSHTFCTECASSCPRGRDATTLADSRTTERASHRVTPRKIRRRSPLL